jgi:hypothetical protein
MTLLKLTAARSIGLLLVTMLLVNSCDDVANENELSNANKFRVHDIDVSDRLYQFITEGLGFDPSTVIDYGDKYVAEGDIAFDKKNYQIPEDFLIAADPHVHVSDGNAPGTRNAASGRTKQWIGTYLQRVSKYTQRNITVSIHSSIPSSGRYNLYPNITEAIQKWNAISCSETRFTIVTGRRGHVEITDDPSLESSPRLVLGLTDYPSGDSPGWTVRLNVDQLVDNQFATGKRTGIIAHELAHAVGIRHSDWQITGTGEQQNGAIQIPQTPTTDAFSIMNYTPYNNNFSSYDLFGIRNAYPAFSTSTTCRAPFYYYWSPTLVDAFFTTQLTEKGGTSFWNYTYQYIECFMNTAQVSGTVPLYRMYSTTYTDHAYRTSSTSFGTYNVNGIAGYIYTTAGTGRLPLYEFYNAQRVDHYYTCYPNNLGTGGQGYVNQGIIGYAYTTDN